MRAGLRNFSVGTDTTGTPGNATVRTWRGRSAFGGAATSCVISHVGLRNSHQVFIQIIEPGALATVRWSRAVAANGSFTAQRSGGTPNNQEFDWFIVH